MRSRTALSALATLSLLCCATAGRATVHTIQAAGTSFSPANITIATGDQVRWVWISGSHTVTSGGDCQSDGLFDAPLNVTHPEFLFTFNTAGPFPYHCTPHCAFNNMEGVITVQGATAVPWPGQTTGEVVMQPPAPNPARGESWIGFSLLYDRSCAITVHDASGRIVRTLARDHFSAGYHEVRWDGVDEAGRTAPAGIYFIRLASQGTNISKTLIWAN